MFLAFVLSFMFASLCSVDTYIFFFHFSYADSEAYNTVESENFFDAEAGVYLQLPNDGLNFDEDSDAEEGNDPQHFSSPTYCKS